MHQLTKPINFIPIKTTRDITVHRIDTYYLIVNICIIVEISLPRIAKRYINSPPLSNLLASSNLLRSPCQGTKDKEPRVSIVVQTIYAPVWIVAKASTRRSHSLSLLSRSPRSERRPCIEKAARSFRTYIALARHEVRSPLSSVLSRECPFRFSISLRSSSSLSRLRASPTSSKLCALLIFARLDALTRSLTLIYESRGEIVVAG